MSDWLIGLIIFIVLNVICFGLIIWSEKDSYKNYRKFNKSEEKETNSKGKGKKR